MAAISYYIPFRNSKIHYLRLGTGAEWLFCFHGYGEDAGSFSILEETLGKQFTLIAIDLPFHGKTEWNEGLLFEPEDLVTLICLIKPAQNKLHLLGYSMGGRVALHLVQLLPEQVVELVLIAPDGLHGNIWQWIATRAAMGNSLFNHIMKDPSWMMGPLHLAARLGLFDKNLLKFVHYYLDDSGQRLILYRRWTTMRKFNPNKRFVKELIIQNKIPVRLLFGKHDPVIVAKHGHHFSKHSDGHIKVMVIEAGHQLLKEKHVALIGGLFVNRET